MSLSKEEIIEAVAEMSVMEVVELVEAMEEKFGVTAAAVQVAAGPAQAEEGGAAAAEEEQSEFNVVLASFGDKKINVIKAIRGLTELSLKDAKELVESAPVTVKEGISKEESDEVKTKLEEAGATVEVKSAACQLSFTTLPLLHWVQRPSWGVL